MTPAASFAGSQIVILSSIDWEAAWQRHQIFATQFAEAGHEVFFVENTGFRNPGLGDLGRLWRKLVNIARAPGGAAFGAPGESGSAAESAWANLRVIPPRVLPPAARLFRRANEVLFVPRLMEILDRAGLKPHPFVICYFPTATTLELLRRLAPSLVVYDCASNFRAHPRAPRDFAALERELLRRSDLVVCDSDFLYEQKRAEHGRVVQIHQGVSEDFFGRKTSDGGFRRFCYYGTWSKDLAPEPLAALCEAGFEITVSGYAKSPSPRLPDTVRRLTPTTREDLPRRLEQFDVFLMPYRLNPFLQGVVPAKIYECLAMGRPVISAPLPSLKPFRDLIYFAEKPPEWVQIARSLPSTETEALARARAELAKSHTHRREFQRLAQAAHAAWAARCVPPAGTPLPSPRGGGLSPGAPPPPETPGGGRPA